MYHEQNISRNVGITGEVFDELRNILDTEGKTVLA